MLSRSDMRQLVTAAKKGWDVPTNTRQQAIAGVREVLNSAKAPERAIVTALEASKRPAG